RNTSRRSRRPISTLARSSTSRSCPRRSAARSAASSCVRRPDAVAEVLTYNPFLPEVREDPYPQYRKLRESDPVHRSPFLEMCAPPGYEGVARARRDPRFSAARTQGGGVKPLEDFEPPRSLLGLPPPDPPRLRTLVTKAFTPRVVEQLRPQAQAIVD